MIEFAEASAVGGFLREAIPNAEDRQPVEDPELAFTQAFVDERLGRPAGKSALAADNLGGLLRTDVGR